MKAIEKYEYYKKEHSTQMIFVKEGSFYKTYKGENETKYLVLSDIILDYEEYLNSEDKTQYSNRISMSLGY